MLKSAFGGLSTGVCRQPQWAYVGVFMYSLAEWCRFYGILFPTDYVPACADSRSGLMSGCLCIRWPGGAGSTAYSFQRIMFRRVLKAAVVQKKPPYRLRRIVRYDGSVIIVIIWQRLLQPQALRPLEVLLLPRMSVQGKVL